MLSVGQGPINISAPIEGGVVLSGVSYTVWYFFSLPLRSPMDVSYAYTYIHIAELGFSQIKDAQVCVCVCERENWRKKREKSHHGLC